MKRLTNANREISAAASRCLAWMGSNALLRLRKALDESDAAIACFVDCLGRMGRTDPSIREPIKALLERLATVDPIVAQAVQAARAGIDKNEGRN